jgi:peptidoglycan/LPS O-acetylase OafA/YrhL
MFSTPTAVWLGEISFPLYLVHVMVLMWLRYALFQDHPGLAEKLGATGLAVMFIFSLAWLLHIYVERPSHRFARRAIASPTLGVAAPAAPTP